MWKKCQGCWRKWHDAVASCMMCCWRRWNVLELHAVNQLGIGSCNCYVMNSVMKHAPVTISQQGALWIERWEKKGAMPILLAEFTAHLWLLVFIAAHNNTMWICTFINNAITGVFMVWHSIFSVHDIVLIKV